MVISRVTLLHNIFFQISISWSQSFNFDYLFCFDLNTMYYDEEFYSEDCEFTNLYDNFHCADIYKKISMVLSDINICLQFFTVLINILHLIVLLQKELRSGAIYILMIGISVADILGYSLDFYNVGFERMWFESIPFYKNTNCLRGDFVQVTSVNILNIFVQMARPTAVWLAMMMALIRTLSVFFPMSNWIQKLAKAKTAILIVLIMFTFWILYYSSPYFEMEFRWYPDILIKSWVGLICFVWK